MAKSGGTRILVLPVSAVLGIVVTRLIIENSGTAAFAQYGLLVGLGALLPFADLGLGAAVVNSVSASDSPGQDDRVRRTLLTTVRLLLCSATVLATVAVVIGCLGVWPTLLGDGLLEGGQGDLAATLCVVLVAAAIPLGFGQRVLTAMGKNHVGIALAGLQTPVVLSALVVCLWLGVSVGPYVAVIAYGATLVLTSAASVYGSRLIRPVVGQVLRDVARIRTVRGTRVFDVAGPMLVQMIALPIAMQTGRLVLSHRSGPEALAEYNLASQVFTPIWAVVTSAGVVLWPVYRRRRALGQDPSPFRMSLVFGAAAGTAALVMAAASPVLARLASGGQIDLSWPIIAAFVVFMTFQGLKYPTGMYLTDGRGLRFQARMSVLMVVITLSLSWWLAGTWGAAGPVLASVVGVGVCQVVANTVFVRRLRSEAAPARRSDVE